MYESQCPTLLSVEQQDKPCRITSSSSILPSFSFSAATDCFFPPLPLEAFPLPLVLLALDFGAPLFVEVFRLVDAGCASPSSSSLTLLDSSPLIFTYFRLLVLAGFEILTEKLAIEDEVVVAAAGAGAGGGEGGEGEGGDG